MVVAFVGAALFAVVAAAKVNFDERLELWAVILIAVATLILGIFVGSLWTRSRSRDKETPEEIEKLQRLSAYTSHFRNSLGGFLSNELSLSEFLGADVDEQISQAICELPASLISKATGSDTKISLWAERQIDGVPRFDVTFDGDHSSKEKRQFNKIDVETSWIHHSVHRSECSPGKSPVKWMNLADSSEGSSDIRAFRSMEYKDGRAFVVDINGEPVRLVALSKQENTFSEPEEVFLMQLWCVLTIAAGLAGSDDDQLAEKTEPPIQDTGERGSN